MHMGGIAVNLSRIIFLMGLGVAAVTAGPITFNAAGSFADGATLSGSVVIDTATGVVESTSLNVSSPDSLTGLLLRSGSGGQGTGDYAFIATVDPSDFVQLEIVGATLVGYTGGSLCASSCAGPSGDTTSYVETAAPNVPLLSSGSLTLASVPEPTSVVLVGSAMLGLLALRRRIGIRKGRMHGNVGPRA